METQRDTLPTIANKEDFRGIFENSFLVMLLIDPDTARILDANNAAADYYGWSIDQLKTMQINEINTLPAAEIMQRMGEASRLEHNRFNMSHRLASGEVREVEVFSGPVCIDGRPVLCSTVLDVTSHLQTQRVLATNAELFRDAFENSLTGIALPTLCGRFNRVNQALCTLLGYDREKLESMQIEEVVHPDERQQVQKNLQTLLGGETEELHFERRYFRSDGKVIQAQVRAKLIRDAEKKPLHYIIEVNDLTSRKNAELERDSLHSQLIHSQKMEAVGLLAGGIAHDFNNLLSVILGYSELLLQNKGEGLQNEYLSEIFSAARRASDLTRQLLAFSRKQVLQLTPTRLNDVIAGFQKLLRRVIGEQIQLEFNFAAENPQVIVDVSQIEQVLLNLSINARDAMPEGGKIVIKTAIREIDEKATADRIGLYPGRFASFSFEDTGIGIDSSILNKIFEPFFTTKGPDKGTGLGLSTVYGIVKQHGGHISVDSKPGHGSRFEVFLPSVDGAASLEGASLARLPKSATANVLVAEDDPLVRRLVETILTRSGFKVLVAEDAETALEMVRQRQIKIDLLVTDVVMPGLDGPKLFKSLSEMFPEIKVLFMSGYSSQTSAFIQELDCPDTFIQKPISTQSLLNKINRLLAHE